MKHFELKDVDNEDLDDFLVKVQDSFKIKFASEDFESVNTLDDLSELVIRKTNKYSDESCTSQQFFYKFKSLVSDLKLSSIDIIPSTKLEDIFPKRNRRKTLSLFENNIGFRLHILTPSKEAQGLLVLMFILSTISFFYYSWQVGIICMIAFFIISRLVFFFGKEFKVDSVAQLVELQTEINYIDSRRNSNSINRNEVKKILEMWFCKEFDLS